MQDRLKFLENHDYIEDPPFYNEDLMEIMEKLYHPKNIADISNMDNSMSYEYLIALDNKGFLSESVDLGDGITMETMDSAIQERNLHYLYVQISVVKPFVSRSIWRYLKGGDDLEVFEHATNSDQQKALDELQPLLEKYGLVYVTEKDLKLITKEDGEEINFYAKYFDTDSQI